VNVLEAQPRHLFHDAFAHLANPAHHTWDRADFPHKADNVVALPGDASLNARDNFGFEVCFHVRSVKNAKSRM